VVPASLVLGVLELHAIVATATLANVAHGVVFIGWISS